jgi:hypothetical protein
MAELSAICVVGLSHEVRVAVAKAVARIEQLLAQRGALS